MILAITESAVPLSTRALGTLLKARYKRERLETHKAELVYLLVKRHYKGVTSPSEAVEMLFDPKTKPKSASQIRRDLIAKLG